MKDKVEEVAEVVRRIPAGNVSTYGEVGTVVGVGARYVGWVMKKAAAKPRTGLLVWSPIAALPTPQASWRAGAAPFWLTTALLP